MRPALYGYVVWWLIVCGATVAVMNLTDPNAAPVGGPEREWRGSGTGAAGVGPSGEPVWWSWNHSVTSGRTDVEGTILEKELASRPWTPMSPAALAKLSSEQLETQMAPYQSATSWSIAHTAPIAGLTYGARFVEIAYGWPFRLYVGRVVFISVPLPGSTSYLITPRRKSGEWIAGGFVSAAIWGLPIGCGGGSLVMWAVRLEVRNRRRRAGVCEGCAYPLGKLTTCPECGRVVQIPAWCQTPL